MYVKSTEPQDLLQAIDQLQIQSQEVVMIFVGEKDAPALENLVELLNQKQIDFFGGLFPALIYDDQKFESGFIIQKFPKYISPILIQGLDQPDFDLSHLPDLNAEPESLSALVLLDGMTSNISLFFSKLYNHYGNSINYMGGGAGSLTLIQKPCVFCNKGTFENAALITFIKQKSRLGVKHGWETIAGPFLATDTQRNVIKELNWQNAFEVYQETVSNHADKEFHAGNFFDIAKGFPFGITKEGAEAIVRDPITVKETGELICVGEIPDNAALMILEGQTENLINAAHEATRIAIGDISHANYSILIFDCISRVLFLEDNFEEELKAVKKEINPKLKPIGALTLGEISSYGDGYIEFFNKTIVVGMLEKQKN